MSEPTAPNFSLVMSILYGGDLGDARTMEHEIQVSIGGLPHTGVIAIVEGDPIRPPRLLRYLQRGNLDLRPSLLDGIVLASFSRLTEELVVRNQNERHVEITEDRQWLLRQMGSSEALLVEFALQQLGTENK